ncbi:hypothetical protein EPJ64_09150 [Brachyspira aalborgi]|uniref:Lipoprotein n=1 Tax=Brachyspira aalborgi TaxID=29522 RepID=A0AB38PXF0_9SPIR|nr:hypothetical protein [Brachyspira aalborgi]TXJ15279.1 hypothetical protein EPJ77_09065 [Brachyspira aalborgi]TXJ18083.1 hypothetical protein EPJ64_09150 [Brachyspira aalborgi]TXJ24038.1 hypothetical protein EPJ73_09240 [Brachyspira aalborgi]TXJ47809.1 hypothetical protein EPJ75_08570 [Brachyspira aalborgi]
MTQKNILKILVIMIAVLSLFAVSCRKASTSPEPTPTPSNPTDPIKNLTGNLLIVSTDGKTNLNSLPLSFVGASATVTEVTENPPKLNLDTTNFIVENNALKLTKFDLSKADAAVSNKVTLTFSLSGENLSRYTDTAEIFVGKMQTNIGTNDFAKQLSGAGKIDNDKDLFGDKNKEKLIQFDFNPELSKDINNYLVFTNSKEGSKDNLISKDKFYSNFNELIKTTWQSFGDSYSIETSIEDKTNAIVKLQFEPATFYEPYMFKFIMTNGEFVLTNASKSK